MGVDGDWGRDGRDHCIVDERTVAQRQCFTVHCDGEGATAYPLCELWSPPSFMRDVSAR